MVKNTGQEYSSKAIKSQDRKYTFFKPEGFEDRIQGLDVKIQGGYNG